jgi:hypothetical protein
MPPKRLVPPNTAAAITSNSRPFPEGLVEAADLRDQHEAGERGAGAGDHVNARGDPVDVDAGFAGGVRVVADCIDLAAELRARQHDPGNQDDKREDDHRQRHANHGKLPEVQHGAGEIKLARTRHEGAGATEEEQRGERHDKGDDAQPNDEEGVDRAERHPRSERNGQRCPDAKVVLRAWRSRRFSGPDT